MGLTAGVLWLVAALTATVGALLPGSPHVDCVQFGVLDALVLLYGVGCVTRRIPWEAASMRTHALVTAALLPLIGLAVWATGGVDSFIQPLVLFPLLYI